MFPFHYYDIPSLFKNISTRAVVLNLFGTRGWFHGRQFFHGLGVEAGGGIVQAMGSGRRSFAHSPRGSPPAVQPSAKQAADC